MKINENKYFLYYILFKKICKNIKKAKKKINFYTYKYI